MKNFKILLFATVCFQNCLIASSVVNRLNEIIIDTILARVSFVSHDITKKQLDSIQHSSLVDAIKQSKIHEVSKIIKNNPAIVQHIDSHGLAPLHYAVALSQADIVRILMAQGAVPTQEDSYGDTAIDIALAHKFAIGNDMNATIKDVENAQKIIKIISPQSKRKQYYQTAE